MAERRGSTMRSIGLLVAGMLTMGAFALAPATAHIGGTTGHLYKHLDKRYVRSANLVRFGQIRMNVGDPDQQIARMGPFTFTARCEQTGDIDSNVRGRVIITTTQEGSAFSTNNDGIAEFGPGDSGNPPLWAELEGGQPGGAPGANTSSGEGHAQAPDGTSVDGRTMIYTNFAGAHCVFAGWLMRVAS